jgi:hypothetical protein
MERRTAILTVAALLALAVPVAAGATAATALRAVGGRTAASTGSKGSIVGSARGSGIRIVIAKNHPVTGVGAASPQALGSCTTTVVDGYLASTTCSFGNLPEISSEPIPGTQPVAATQTGGSPEPPSWVATSCSTELDDGYLLITDC